MILSNITVPLLGLVDTAVIGHLSHAYYLGGSTVGAMIITFITWLCGFLRMSTTGLSAQALGQNDRQQSLLVLTRGVFVGLTIGLCLILLQVPYLQLSLWLAGGSEQVQFYAQQYAEIRIWGLPAALANIVVMGWLLGQHRAKAVMWLLIFTNLVNLSLDLLFVLVFQWQVQGVAAATLIAEYSGLLAGAVIIIKGRLLPDGIYHSFIKLRTRVFSSNELLSYFKLNRDILIRTLCLEVCFIFITFQGARLGDNVVAANAILMNFLLLISFGLDGIANAAEALIGKAWGEKKTQSINYILRRCTMWTVIFAIIYSLIFWIAGEMLISTISNIEAVVVMATQYLPWIILLPIIGCWCYLYDGVYVGITRADIMRNSMVIATFGVFFPLWLLFSDYQNHGLWFAFTGFMAARGATLGWHYYQHIAIDTKKPAN
ncbi:MATE family efflux transporter [Thalassotalea sp. M1531]|uniref:MATE family efflux transporter n=2 Tax=Thalassotalea algicola TaxID=2716224 RepID=A0A7Y0LF66_9GAMM|nr:MATE family efflux transporter [Thalassotalea algicola]